MSQMLGLQVIDGAIKIFERPGSWTRWRRARTFMGMPVLPSSWWATRFCLDGALRRSATSCGGYVALQQATELVLNEKRDYISWNDNVAESQDEVLAFLKDVRQKAKVLTPA